MTFPSNVSDHSKDNLTQKCAYLVGLFKAKDLAKYEAYKARLDSLKVEESYGFYNELLEEYKKLVDRPDLKQPAEKAPKAPAKKTAKAPSKKAPAKKAAKTPAKKVAKKAAKKTAKKAAKKPAKKAAPKKAAKKVAKKAAKRPAKKASKKAKKK